MTAAAPPGWANPRWTALRCFACEASHPVAALAGVCADCGMPLRADYDLSGLGDAPRARLNERPATLWRYREALPVAPGHEVSLGETVTPLVPVAENVWVKDEARQPTGSFKARGMSVAVSVARAFGVAALRAPSAGNAAGALAAYGAAAGLAVVVAMPDDTPRAFVDECRAYGAEVKLVPGTIADAGRWLREHGPRDAFDVSTLREPHRIEGKKTMGFEIWEEFRRWGGGLPDVILYPTGGGTGLVGMGKAWRELAALGWLEAGARAPRMVSVQVEGCAPVVAAHDAGLASTTSFPDPRTRAWGLRVPSPLGGFLCLRTVRETGGTAVAVAETAMEEATRELTRSSGLDICPEGGAAWAALALLRRRGWIAPGERVVVFNTGTGLKYR